VHFHTHSNVFTYIPTPTKLLSNTKTTDLVLHKPEEVNLP